ncbi:MAG: HPF/RaiA family ribosome-associated protein, partial [Mameliella sp.]|nr:HPF/RaiA family ribosome-associated protein [Phaeodactylibacter sp.]
LFVSESAKTFESSIDSATSTMRRQLIRYKDRLRRKSA